MSELNVEKIMEEIRYEIREKGYTKDMLSFSDVDIETEDTKVGIEKFERIKFNEELFNLNMLWNVNPYREIDVKPGLKGKCVAFIKKIIRKCIRFYLAPIVWEQDTFNATTVRLLNMMNLYMEENQRLSDQVVKMKDEHEILVKRINQLYELHYNEE